MRYRRESPVWSFVVKPALVSLLLVGVFGLVWMRSSITSMEYDIGSLEKRKTQALKERKLLEADLASLRSIREVEDRSMGMVFPDREKVVYVKRDKGSVPYAASLRR